VCARKHASALAEPTASGQNARPFLERSIVSASAEEFRTLVRLALPLMAAQLLQMAQGVMDTIMAGHLSAPDLAGIALGLNVLWPSQFLVSGFVLAATPIIAQLRGAGRVGEVGEIVRQGFWIVAFASLVLMLFWRNVGFVYEELGIEPHTKEIAIGYMHATSWGAFPLLGYFLVRYLCEGMGHTKPAMYMALAALVLKWPLNYAFMYGHWGVPKLGGVGCGWASAILWWAEFFGMLLVTRMPFVRVTGLFAKFSWPKWSVLQRFLVIGLPIGATGFAEVFAFSLMGLLIGRFGPETLASHQIVGNLNGMTFMVPLALGMATTIRVGFNVGANDFDRARLSAMVALRAAALFALVVGVLLLLGRFFVVALFSTDPQVTALAATVVIFVAAYQLADDTQVVAIGALRGYKDTQVPMWIALFGYWIVAVPIACWLGFGWLAREPLGIYGFWAGMTAGLAFVAVAATYRLWRTAGDAHRIARLAAA
jgi:MATE family multidrug resistance protein